MDRIGQAVWVMPHVGGSKAHVGRRRVREPDRMTNDGPANARLSGSDALAIAYDEEIRQLQRGPASVKRRDGVSRMLSPAKAPSHCLDRMMLNDVSVAFSPDPTRTEALLDVNQCVQHPNKHGINCCTCVPNRRNMYAGLMNKAAKFRGRA